MAVLRGQFSSRLGFILAAAGSAVGIGNLVAFPVMAAKNGGAAFLVVYLAFVALVCFPVMMAEIAMGRASQKNPVGAFDSLSGGSRGWRKISGLAILTPFMIAVFYMVITVWILLYMTESALGNLDVLADPATFGLVINSPSLFLYLILAMGLIFFILSGGVRDGIERAAKFLMPLLICMLIGLVLFVLTLDNASAGLAYYLIPDFSKIDSSVVNGALNQAFFSLSLGMGILITYGSYFSKDEKIVNATALVAVTDTAVAFFAGLLILPAVFAINPDVDVNSLSDSSVGMIFSYLPQIFLSMQDIVGYTGASIAATAFFALVFFAALTSMVSITEIPIAYVVDEKGLHRRTALVIVAGLLGLFVIMATVSFGMVSWLTDLPFSYGGQSKSFFSLLEDVFYLTILPFMGFLVCLFCSYRWKRSDFMGEIATGDASYRDSLLAKYVGFSLGTFIPLILLAVFLNNVAQIYFNFNLLGF